MQKVHFATVERSLSLDLLVRECVCNSQTVRLQIGAFSCTKLNFEREREKIRKGQERECFESAENQSTSFTEGTSF